MSNPLLDKATEDRLIWLRGKVHPYDRIEARKTALVVVDMQNFFCAEDSPYGLATARAVVPAINRLADATRKGGGLVVWIQMAYDESWSNFYGTMLSPTLRAQLREGLKPGSQGYAVWPKLEVREADVAMEKIRFSAFLPGYCKLPDVLRARGLDTVLITGTLTNTCCETSARDAIMTGFRCVMISDGCAAALDSAHTATLRNFLQVSGDVRSTEEAITLLQKSTVAAAVV
jgi:ureidoacrylate peracid hydrolase